MNRRLKLVALAASIVVVALAIVNPFTSPPPQPTSRGVEGVILQGAGATFPYPQISEWARRFQERYGIQVVYQSAGSGAGQSMFFQGVVDFACSDPPLPKDQWERYRGLVLQVPWLFGPVVVVYNVPEIPDNYALRLDAVALAKIYKGEIVYWNDAYIKELNPDIAHLLPSKEIIVVYRSDSSGTTEVFTKFLYKASNGEWPRDLVGKTVNWPVIEGGRGVGGKGNEGVSQVVLQTPYSIGYVEWSYAIRNNLRVTSIRNNAGNYVTPSRETLEEALRNVVFPGSPLEDFSEVLDAALYAPGANSYPILSPTYILIWRNQRDPRKAEALRLFLKWIVEEGYNYIVEGYIAPPREARKLLVEAANLIQVSG